MRFVCVCKQVLLHVAAVAIFTLTINAPSMAPLLRALRLTSTSQEQEVAFSDLSARVSDYAWREYVSSSSSTAAGSTCHSPLTHTHPPLPLCRYFRLLTHGGSAYPEKEHWVRAVPGWISIMEVGLERGGFYYRSYSSSKALLLSTCTAKEGAWLVDWRVDACEASAG